MPTYDYVCDACEHRFEHFQGIREALLRTCPVCKKKKLRRLIGAGAGILFKGSGFYETDYKRAPGGGGSAAGKPSGKNAETGAEKDGGSPAKPAPAPKTSDGGGGSTATPAKDSSSGGTPDASGTSGASDASSASRSSRSSKDGSKGRSDGKSPPRR